MRWPLVILVSALLVGSASAQTPGPAAKSAASPAAPAARPDARPAGKPELDKLKQTAPMQVVIVRSADPACADACPEWIAAQGRIDPGTPAQFRRVLAKLGNRKLPVLIDSPGGNVDEALAIGRMIRAKGLAIAVTRTELVACAPADAACRKREASGTRLGHARPLLSKCASSCAFVLAGGTQRHVGRGAFVGVHQVTSFQTRVKVLRTYRVETRREWGVPVETVKRLVSEKRIGESTRRIDTREADYAKIARYFAEMGVGEGVMRALRATPGTDIYWFTPVELQTSALATALTSGEQLLAPVPAAAPVPTTAPPAGPPPEGRLAQP